jgi:hypothetical protein
MRLGNILIGLTLILFSCGTPKECNAQIGSVKTEEYTAGFEKENLWIHYLHTQTQFRFQYKF